MLLKVFAFSFYYLACISVLEASSGLHHVLPDKSVLPEPSVNTSFGTVVGTWDETESGKQFKAFRGLQYGNIVKRFVEAEPFEPQGSLVYANQEGPICPQLNVFGENMSEECLFLNIFTPEQASKLSVMVWIHGGALQSGSGNNLYYGPHFIMEKDVILVTINYRLGAFGFLSFETSDMPGNTGFKDQILALKWVKQNINSFGGNPEDITIFGESAGSFSVMYQVVSPLSQGLFQKAIAQSGAPFTLYLAGSRPGKPRETALALGTSLGCSSDTDAILQACLESTPVEDILNAVYLCIDDNLCTFNPWDAVIDQFAKSPFLPDTPENLVKQGKYSKVPMLVGVVGEEGIYSAARYITNETSFDIINNYWDYYGPVYIFDTSDPTKEEIELANLIKYFYLQNNPASIDNIHDVIDMFSDNLFWSGAHRFSTLASNNSNIFTYLLTYKSKNSFADYSLGVDSEKYGLGPCHADDLYHLFKMNLAEYSYTNDDLSVREEFVNWWIHFAQNSEPSSDGSWTPFNINEPAYMDIKPNPEMAFSDRYKQRMDFWMEILDSKGKK